MSLCGVRGINGSGVWLAKKLDVATPANKRYLHFPYERLKLLVGLILSPSDFLNDHRTKYYFDRFRHLPRLQSGRIGGYDEGV